MKNDKGKGNLYEVLKIEEFTIHLKGVIVPFDHDSYPLDNFLRYLNDGNYIKQFNIEKQYEIY